MATLPLRPPQFSDDVAWLPAWLQPNQSTPTSQDIANHRLFQNVDPFKGENSQIKEPNVLTNGESKYNICRLYLSGEEGSAATLTSSSEKVLHFNLHLSTDGTSSIISNPLLPISQVDNLNSTLAPVGTRDNSQSNIGHDPPKLIFAPFTSSDNYPQCSPSQTPLINDGGQNTLDILNSKCTECDDISDAVELSVAASEALIIHKVLKSRSHSKLLSTSAILEVALRVKQARLNESNESSCCFKDSGNTADTLSDLGDSDMEDAYTDVGLHVSSVDNIPPEDPSTSRVMETPMSAIHGEGKEVQCEWQGDQGVDSDNCFATEPQEKNLVTNKPKDLPAEILGNEKEEKLNRNPALDLVFVNQSNNGSSDDLQTLQKGKNDVAYVDGYAHQLEVKSPAQPQQFREAKEGSLSTIQHSHYVGINNVNDRSSSGFQSRWFGGWTGMVEDACGDIKSKGRPTIPNYFVGETSYLSESIDIFSDQNSVVHGQQLCSNTSKSGKHADDFYKSTNEEPYVSEEVVKDSTASADPLCSMVPCSISAEYVDTELPTNNDDGHQLLVSSKSLPSGAENTAEIAQTSSGHHDKIVGREELGEHDIGYPPFYRQLTSLKTYSNGVPENSALPFKLNPNCGFVNLGLNNARLLSNSTKSPNDKDTQKKSPIRSISNCTTFKSNNEDEEMKIFSVEQRLSCVNTSENGISRKQPPTPSIFSFTTATNNMKNHVENTCERFIQDHCERNAEMGVELQVQLQDITTSPVVLCRKSRRFKAPKLLVSDVSTANPLEDQAPASNEICDKIRKSPQDHFKNLPRSDIPAKKRVRFSDVDFKLQIPQEKVKKNLRSIHTSENRSSCRLGDRPENCDQEQGTASQEVKERLTKCRIKARKRTIFQGLDFLLTGFSKKKEKEMEGLLRKHGGSVLSEIPAPLPHPRRRRSLRFNAQRLPVVLCTKKLQTTRFLYGCAVNAFLLKVGWAYNSIRAGSVLAPDKYLILSNQSNMMLSQLGKSICQNGNDYIFDRVGVMLQGTHNFCTKFSKVIKHGHGHVHKSLQWLVQSLEKKKISLGVIVVEDENRATRHLKKCASEQKIAVVPARWIINSLIEGKLLPLEENCRSSNPQATNVPETSVLHDWSEEI